MTKKTTLRLPIQEKFYTNKDMHEFLEREASEIEEPYTYANSKQNLIERFLFPAGWRRRLDYLRKKHRAAGIPDHEFYDNQTRKELGLRERRGTRNQRNSFRGIIRQVRIDRSKNGKRPSA